MRVVSGSNRYTIKANWKLLAENSVDSYHLLPTHRTYVDYVTGLGTDDSGDTMAARPPGVGRAWVTVIASQRTSPAPGA